MARVVSDAAGSVAFAVTRARVLAPLTRTRGAAHRETTLRVVKRGGSCPASVWRPAERSGGGVTMGTVVTPVVTSPPLAYKTRQGVHAS